MHGLVSLNQKLTLATDVAIPALSSAALYGKGIFTTIAIYDGKPFLWEKHWRRLCNNAKEIGIDLSDCSEVVTLDALDELTAANKVDDGRARFTFFDESPSEIWPFDGEQKTSLLITTVERRAISSNFKIEVSLKRIHSSSKLHSIKSCNYLDNILALEAARARGFDEAIRLNEHGEVASACMANVFWLLDGKLFTPSLRTGCLPGTTREFVLENQECEQVENLDDKLYRAEAIFLTSAGLGVTRVAEFEGHQLAGEDHPIRKLIP
jgi:branched-subunit amino acid aminotransferase/4-amino-4-deoxychorismate lyase